MNSTVGLYSWARFGAKYQPEPNSGCWLWTAALNSVGYGVVTLTNGKNAYAHRLSYERVHGEIPDGLFCCHKCDTPCCVNPDHIFLGDHTENARDSMAKRRHAAGERSGRARLTEGDVVEIRRLCSEHQLTHVDIARRFGVSSPHVSAIWKNRFWKASSFAKR